MIIKKELDEMLQHKVNDVPRSCCILNVSLHNVGTVNIYHQESLPEEPKEETVKNG